jgi:hypothetical protein
VIKSLRPPARPQFIVFIAIHFDLLARRRKCGFRQPAANLLRGISKALGSTNCRAIWKLDYAGGSKKQYGHGAAVATLKFITTGPIYLRP